MLGLFSQRVKPEDLVRNPSRQRAQGTRPTFDGVVALEELLTKCEREWAVGVVRSNEGYIN